MWTPLPDNEKEVAAAMSGCLTCRSRKVKCDGRPNICLRCEKLRIECRWRGTPREGASNDEDGSVVEDPGSLTQAGHKRLRASVACDTCRKRKLRCDSERPSCSTCVRRQIPCIYDTARDTKSQQVTPTSETLDSDRGQGHMTGTSGILHGGNGEVLHESSTSSITGLDRRGPSVDSDREKGEAVNRNGGQENAEPLVRVADLDPREGEPNLILAHPRLNFIQHPQDFDGGAPWIEGSYFGTLAQELDNWRRVLPTNFAFEERHMYTFRSSRHLDIFLMIHAWYHQTIMELYGAWVPGHRGSVTVSSYLQPPVEFLQSCMAKSLAHARNITLLNQKVLKVEPNHTFRDAWFGICVLDSTSIQVAVLLQEGADGPGKEALQLLKLNLRALTNTRRKIPLSDKIYQECSRIIKTAGFGGLVGVNDSPATSPATTLIPEEAHDSTSAFVRRYPFLQPNQEPEGEKWDQLINVTHFAGTRDPSPDRQEGDRDLQHHLDPTQPLPEDMSGMPYLDDVPPNLFYPWPTEGFQWQPPPNVDHTAAAALLGMNHDRVESDPDLMEMFSSTLPPNPADPGGEIGDRYIQRLVPSPSETQHPSDQTATAPASITAPQSGPIEKFEITTDQKVLNVQNVALATAEAIQKPSPFTKSMLKLYYFVAVSSLLAAVSGYDGSLMGSINSYKQYRSYFGFSLTAGTPSTGIVYAIYTIGSLVGAFVAGPIADYRGRRIGMFISVLVIFLGTCVQATATNLAAFMVGRFFLGVGASIGPSAGLPYVSEMAHPSWRGRLTGFYNTFYFVGSIPGTFIPYGTSTIVGTNSWRIPIWIQMVLPGIVALNIMFFPETPRWLMANDRHDEALEVMAKYHGDGDRDSPIVQLEFREMLAEISIEGSDKRWWDYRGLFNSRQSRYRTALTICISFFGQWAGNGAVSYYYPQMLAGAGITNAHLVLLLQGINAIISFAGALIGAYYTDKWGRRPQLLISTSLIVILFAIITALNATNLTTSSTGALTAISSAQAKAEVAMIFIFAFVFAAGWTPLQGLYCVEVLAYENRAKGMAFHTFWTNIAGFYNTFVTGIAFTDAGWKYYFLFIFWDTFAVIVIYFFFVETKNRTLEEMSEIFTSPTPVKTSVQKSKIVIDRHDGVVDVLEKEI